MLSDGPMAGAVVELDPRIDQHRRELTGFCYRMLGSAVDADDAVQEVLVRAWKGLTSFEGRSSIRSWLYKIATNVCLDALESRKRRALPVDMSPSPSAPVIASLGSPLVESAFVQPMPSDRLIQPVADPAEQAVLRNSVRLAFVAALQHLPPKQREVLILCEVLRWSAAEVATLLETTVASVNSALQRARATMETVKGSALGDSLKPTNAGALSPEHTQLLRRYVAAFESYDMSTLATLLAENAIQSMPPYSLWLQGRDNLITWMLGPGAPCEGSRLIAMDLNGTPAFAQYRHNPDRSWTRWALQLLDIRDGRIEEMTFYLGPDLFERFGLPLEPPEALVRSAAH